MNKIRIKGWYLSACPVGTKVIYKDAVRVTLGGVNAL